MPDAGVQCLCVVFATSVDGGATFERHFVTGVAEFGLFVLADGMKVEGALLAHGLLHIDLIRPEPERLVQRIPIKTAG